MGRSSKILRTAKLQEIESVLSKRIGEYVGNAAQYLLKISFSLPSHSDLFEKFVGLQVTERPDMPPTPGGHPARKMAARTRVATYPMSDDEVPFEGVTNLITGGTASTTASGK